MRGAARYILAGGLWGAGFAVSACAQVLSVEDYGVRPPDCLGCAAGNDVLAACREDPECAAIHACESQCTDPGCWYQCVRDAGITIEATATAEALVS